MEFLKLNPFFFLVLLYRQVHTIDISFSLYLFPRDENEIFSRESFNIFEDFEDFGRWTVVNL